MNGDTWMPFYIGDYLRDTMHLTAENHGCYVLLLCHCWIRGEVRDDDDTLRSVTKCPEANWARTKPILRDFFSVQNGVWIHKRVENEKAESKRLIEQRQSRTAAATKARWPSVTESVTESVSISVTQPPSPSPSPSPVQSQTQRGPKRVIFTKPTLEEVRLVTAKTGLPDSDAEWFWNKCEANGWTNGGHPIKSWQHTIASWKSAGYMPSQKPKAPGNHQLPERESSFLRELRAMRT